jgi:hypothetical protein
LISQDIKTASREVNVLIMDNRKYSMDNPISPNKLQKTEVRAKVQSSAASRFKATLAAYKLP